jgi:hypothetical protein
MQNVKYLFDLFLSVYGIAILFALGSVLLFKFLSTRPNDVEAIENTLDKVEVFLNDKLGDKATIVLNAWKKGLENAKDGEYTDQEMLENFLDIVKVDLKKADFDQLTTDEKKVVEEAAVMTFSTINTKKKTEIAFQVLSKK